MRSKGRDGMGDVKTHRDLDVWKEGIELVVKIYEIVRKFPKEERHGLVEQIKRSAISIPSNIAEGAARNSKRKNLCTSCSFPLGQFQNWKPSSLSLINVVFCPIGASFP